MSRPYKHTGKVQQVHEIGLSQTILGSVEMRALGMINTAQLGIPFDPARSFLLDIL